MGTIPGAKRVLGSLHLGRGRVDPLCPSRPGRAVSPPWAFRTGQFSFKARSLCSCSEDRDQVIYHLDLSRPGLQLGPGSPPTPSRGCAHLCLWYIPFQSLLASFWTHSPRMGSAKQGRACGIRSSLGMRTKLRHEGWGGGGAHMETSLRGVEGDRSQPGSSWCSCLASGAQPWLRLSLPSPGIPGYTLDSNRRGLGEDRCVRVSVCLCGYDEVAEAGLCLRSGS